MPDHKNEILALGQRYQELTLVRVEAKRLFTQDMLVHSECIRGDRTVQACRRRHNNGVKRRVSEHGAVIPGSAQPRKTFAQRGQPSFIGIRDSSNRATFQLRKNPNMIRSPMTAANYANIEMIMTHFDTHSEKTRW